MDKDTRERVDKATERGNERGRAAIEGWDDTANVTGPEAEDEDQDDADEDD